VAWIFWGLIHGMAKRFYFFYQKFSDRLLGLRVVSTWIKWVGQEADCFHLGLKLRMIRVIFSSYVGCPIAGM
jgi:hypothetical protein